MNVSQVRSEEPATLDDLATAPSGEAGKVGKAGGVGTVGAADPSRRTAIPLRLPGRVDLGVAVALAFVGIAMVVAVDTRMTRPFWYDEVWRAHFVSEPMGTFWGELAAANVPSAFGWVTLTRLTGEVFGWHVAALRAPAALALPLLAVTSYVLARRFSGVVPAAFAALALAVSGTIVDLGTQLKPYTIEALVTVGIVALWSAEAASARARLARRCTAGIIALFSVPAVFVIIPLAVADVVGAHDRWQRVRAAAVAAPAVMLTGLHSVLFVAHQTAQRGGRYWDTYFLAGRDPGEAVRFVGAQLLAIASGAPPGVDGPDINLVHPTTDGTAVSTWLITPAVGIALVAGALRLARHPRRPKAAQPLPSPRVASRAWPLPTPPEAGVPRARVTDGRLLLAALVGAEVLQLAASTWRYWPFGPVRPNLFVVPLILIVAAAGADALARGPARSLRLRRTRRAQPGPALEPASDSACVPAPGVAAPGLAVRGVAGSGPLPEPASADPARIAAPTAPAAPVPATPAPMPRPVSAAVSAVAAVTVVAVLAVLAAVPLAGVTAMRPLWQAQDQLRSIELLVDATTVTRELYRPGDLVIVGGRLARPGWLYAMESSDDAPFLTNGKRDVAGEGRENGGSRSGGDAGSSGTGEAHAAEVGTTSDKPRVPRAATVFLQAVGDAGVSRAVAARPGTANQVIFFVLDYDRRGTQREVDAIQEAGWCETGRWTFELTGTLHSLARCGRP